MPQIDPKFTFYFGIWTKLLVFIAGYSVEHAPALVQQYAPPVQWVLGMFAQGNDIVLIALIGLSSSKVGPLISQTAVKVMIAAIALSLLLMPHGAQAQQRGIAQPIDLFKAIQQFNDQLAAQKKSIDTLVQKQATAVGQQVSTDVTNALNQFAEFVGTDTTNAANLAISIPSTLDGNGQICWDAMTDASKIFQQNPVPTPDIATTLGFASTIERVRLLAMTANNVCQNVACTQVVADATGALSAALPLKAPLPNLHDICSMIPTVAKAPPTRTTSIPLPESTPSPTPTPSASPTAKP